MRDLGIKQVAGAIIVISIFLSGCQGSAPASQPGAGQTSKSAENVAASEKKSEATTGSGALAKTSGAPTTLPKSTQEYLAKLKMDTSVLAGLDQELAVPQEWVEGAKKEGKFKILWTVDPDLAEIFFKPFMERYPYIKAEGGRSEQESRIKLLTGLQAGRVDADVVNSLGGIFFQYKEADALADISDLPNWKNNPEGTKDPGGLWIGQDLRYWAMAYNTTKVKEQDLPKTWEDLLTNPVWRNGNLAIGNRPQLWMLPLWKKNGEKWATDYIDRLFTEVKPQMRKEGMNALVELAGAGEFAAVVPGADYRAYYQSKQGSPVSFWSPEPIPLASTEVAIFKKAPNPNAARIFVNWLVSKEGQLAQFISDGTSPVHPDMRGPEWVPFSNIVKGKATVFRLPEDEKILQPEMQKYWDQAWLKGGGK